MTRSGSTNKPITLRGPASAILQGSGYSGYGMSMIEANYWTLSGFTVRGYQKGIVLDGSNRNILDSLTVNDVGLEAVHFRGYYTSTNGGKFSSNVFGVVVGSGYFDDF